MIAPFRQLAQNVRYAVRTLLRQRVFLVAALLSLGVAIAVNTTIYAVLDGMLEPRAAGAHPERLYSVRYYGDPRRVLPSDAVVSALRTGMRTYDAVSGYRVSSGAVGRGTRLRDGQIIRVRPDFFVLAGVSALDGRLAPVAASDGVPSVVISERLRAELFTDRSSVIGATVSVDGRAARVVGVTRRYAAFDALDADVWELVTDKVDAVVPINLIRLRADANTDGLYRELSTLAARLAVAAGEQPSDTRFAFRAIRRQFHIRGLHQALIAGALAVLLVACANLGNLQMARGLDRGRELATRAALGGGRRDLIALLMTESAVLAAAGLALGVLLSYWAIELLRAVVPTEVAGYIVAPDPSWRMIAVAGGIAVVCLALIGLVPAIRVSAVNLSTMLKSGAGTGAHRGNRLRYGLLLAAQIGLTLPLVTAAVLMARGSLQFADPEYRTARMYGIDPDSIVVAAFNLPAQNGSFVRVAPLVADILGRVRGVAGVSDVGVGLGDSPTDAAVTIENAVAPVELPAPMWRYSLVTPGYLRASGFPIEQGRDFLDGAHAQSSVIVNRETATFLWPGQNPVGKLVKLGASRSSAPWLTVIGVRGDHFDAETRRRIAGIDTLRLSALYRVITTSDSVRAGNRGLPVSIYARASHDSYAVSLALRRVVEGLGPTAPPRVASLREEYGISASIVRRQFMSSLFAGAAAICIALATFGVYAIVAQSVAQRRREVAVRIFLGATPRGILRLILREGNVFVLAGIAVGLHLSTRTVGWLSMFLGEESSSVVFAYAGVCAAVFVMAALAGLGPALRATRVDPAEALRSD